MATKAPRLKKAAASACIPQNREATAAAIREIGEIQRNLTRIAADMNDEIADVKQKYETEAEPLRMRLEALQQGVQTWSEANRDAITQNGKVKTAIFTTGEVLWRKRPPSVVVRGAEAVLDQLRKLGLKRFIREKEEVNKEAILNEPEAVAHVTGISISQGEDFVVVPFETELAEAV